MFFAAVARARWVLMRTIAGAVRALDYRAKSKSSLTRLGGMALGSMLMPLALVAPVAASDGCNMINDGTLNTTLTYLGDTLTNTILVNFDQGETLNYSLNTTAEAMALIVIRYDSADTVIINSYDASNPVSVSGSYVVSLPPGAGSVTRAYIQLLGGSGGNYTAVGASATWNISCVPAPPRPVVTGISPASGSTAGGTSVIITGTGFAGANAVRFGATDAVSFTVNSATSISATAPAGTGTIDVTVSTAGGTSATSAADQFVYVAAPTVSSITSTAGPTGGGTTVTINGTGFAAAPGTGAVRFGATDATYTIDSNTQITATSPAGSVGVVDVTVTTPGGTSATSSADQFTYLAAPTITSLDPTTGPTLGGTDCDYIGYRLLNCDGSNVWRHPGHELSGQQQHQHYRISSCRRRRTSGCPRDYGRRHQCDRRGRPIYLCGRTNGYVPWHDCRPYAGRHVSRHRGHRLFDCHQRDLWRNASRDLSGQQQHQHHSGCSCPKRRDSGCPRDDGRRHQCDQRCRPV